MEVFCFWDLVFMVPLITPCWFGKGGSIFLVCYSCSGEEKVALLLVVSSFGKDFATIAHCVGIRYQDLCQVFFSKAWKCLGLDLICHRCENLGSPANDNSNPGAMNLQPLTSLLVILAIIQVDDSHLQSFKFFLYLGHMWVLSPNRPSFYFTRFAIHNLPTSAFDHFLERFLLIPWLVWWVNIVFTMCLCFVLNEDMIKFFLFIGVFIPWIFSL